MLFRIKTRLLAGFLFAAMQARNIKNLANNAVIMYIMPRRRGCKKAPAGKFLK